MSVAQSSSTSGDGPTVLAEISNVHRANIKEEMNLATLAKLISIQSPHYQWGNFVMRCSVPTGIPRPSPVPFSDIIMNLDLNGVLKDSRVSPPSISSVWFYPLIVFTTEISGNPDSLARLEAEQRALFIKTHQTLKDLNFDQLSTAAVNSYEYKSENGELQSIYYLGSLGAATIEGCPVPDLSASPIQCWLNMAISGMETSVDGFYKTGPGAPGWSSRPRQSKDQIQQQYSSSSTGST